MTVRPHLLVRLSGLAPTLIVALLCLYRPPSFANLEYSVYDVLLRWTQTKQPDSRLVIVDVDERSLSTIGQWPWRRDIVGNLVSRLRDLGAAVIALDVIFAESDRLDGPGVGTDAALAETLEDGRVVVGYALTFDPPSGEVSACVRHPLNVPILRRGDEQTDDPFFRATGAICSLPALTQAAGASGFLNAAPDSDGLLRRAPLLLEFDGRVYPSLALAAVSKAAGTENVALRVDNVNSTSLLLDGANGPAVPLDGKSNLLVRFRGPKRTFPYVSAADVLGSVAGADSFKGKVVFVGTTALGTREVVTTPLDTLFAGVEVHATVADNLLQKDFIRRPEPGVTLETQVVLMLGIVAALLVGRFGIVWGSLAGAASVAAAWTGAGVLLAGGIFLSPLYPTLAVMASLGVTAVTWFALEHRRADRAVQDRVTSQRLMVQSLLSLTTVRDAETGEHSRRTERYTRLLAEQLSLNPRFSSFLTPQNINLLSSLAPLHDIGKVGVPDQVLNKPGALTPEEMVEMRRHPAYGRDVIVNAERDVGVHDDQILTMAKAIVYTHHEKWDGTGYPEGLRGTDIPIPGRVMAVVDVYDAILTRRLYRPTMAHEDAVAFIVKGKGTHFDPDVIEAFEKVSGQFRDQSG